MIHSIFICALAVGTITAAPQFVTFKDGKIGVNFGGYTAEAGLGGFLTGNAAHGGLSASAGTPFGQRAAAGLGGQVNGNAAGRAYAGAQATDTIGASAILGGSTGPQQNGILGAEAHANGNSVTKTITSDVNAAGSVPQDSPSLVVPTDLPKEGSVQRVKPPKKYTSLTGVENPQIIEVRKSVIVPAELPQPELVVIPALTVVKGRRFKHIHPARRHYNLYKQVIYEPLPSQRFNGEEVRTVKTTYKDVQKVRSPAVVESSLIAPGNQDAYQVVEKDVQLSPGGLNQFLNIPIGILQSIRDNLQPVGVRKQVTYTSAV